MPRTLPTGTDLWLAKQGATAFPVVLLDIQTIDGTQYFWSDYEGNYPARIVAGSPSTFYHGYIKSGCSFTCTRDTSTNAGDLLVQNLSGNTIDRDVASALDKHEFEGAFAVTRLWIPLLDVAVKEFHTSLTEQNPTEDEASFRQLQLLDPTQYFIAADVEGTDCTWRYKGLQCGSAGSAATCPKTFPACIDPTRAAGERFNGIITTVPNTVNAPPPNIFVPPPGRGLFGGGGKGNRLAKNSIT